MAAQSKNQLKGRIPLLLRFGKLAHQRRYCARQENFRRQNVHELRKRAANARWKNKALIQAARLRNNPEAYRCTKKSKTHRCTQKFIREEELEHQLSLMLREYAIYARYCCAVARYG